jgi:membrane protein
VISVASAFAGRSVVTHGWSFERVARLAKETVAGWIADRAPSMGAALAYYTLFSVAPLLVVVIAVAGWFFGADAARGAVMEQIDGLVGQEGAVAIEGLLRAASDTGDSLTAVIVGLLTTLIGATTVFNELQDDLDRIWKVPPSKRPSGIWGLLRARFLSFGMILGIGFLLIVSLAVSAGLAALGRWWGPLLEGWEYVLKAINFVVSFAVVTGLFAMVYKIMPSVTIRWRDVWVGAAVTALLFTIGKTLIGLYIGHSGLTSAYGAAGSLVVVLVWVYYSTQIFLLGAEFTKVQAADSAQPAAASAPGAAPDEPTPVAAVVPRSAGGERERANAPASALDRLRSPAWALMAGAGAFAVGWTVGKLRRLGGG